MHDPRARLGGEVSDVAVDGGTIEVEALGAGPPVIFVHGWTLDRRAWRPQVEGLAGRFRTIAFDRRGFGRSTAPPDPAREPADLAAIGEALGLDRFALVGMSQGARVALAFAARHRDRVTALALQGAPLSGVAPDPGEDEDIPLEEMTALAAAGKRDAMRRLWRGHPLMRVEGLRATAGVDGMLADYEGRDLTAPGRALAVTRADLARVAAPALVLTGADEPPWRHKVARVLAGALAHAERTDIPGGGHLCNLSRPDEYNAALARFLDSAIPERIH